MHATSAHTPRSYNSAARSPFVDPPYVDLPNGIYHGQRADDAPAQHTANPVPDLIPDDLYQLLRSNDLINDKGIRDYIIRRAFKTMREEHQMKSSEALAKLQTVYPYLQPDTLRKIIYRIGPQQNRKMMF